MIAPAYAWHCLGDGHAPCDARGDGPRADKEAEKHAALGHATTTCVAGGPMDKTRAATTTHARPEGGQR